MLFEIQTLHKFCIYRYSELKRYTSFELPKRYLEEC